MDRLPLFFGLTFNRLAMGLEIIPGAPEKVRLFWQAYFWILVSTALALPFLKPTRAQLGMSLRKWLKRAPRPVFAAAIFFAVAFVINHSGKGAGWQLVDPSRNMVQVIAAASGIGGGLASVISPAKLQNASASIDRIGEEAQVVRTTFVISLAITAVCAAMTLVWAF